MFLLIVLSTLVFVQQSLCWGHFNLRFNFHWPSGSRSRFLEFYQHLTYRTFSVFGFRWPGQARVTQDLLGADPLPPVCAVQQDGVSDLITAFPQTGNHVQGEEWRVTWRSWPEETQTALTFSFLKLNSDHFRKLMRLKRTFTLHGQLAPGSVLSALGHGVSQQVISVYTGILDFIPGCVKVPEILQHRKDKRL